MLMRNMKPLKEEPDSKSVSALVSLIVEKRPADRRAARQSPVICLQNPGSDP